MLRNTVFPFFRVLFGVGSENPIIRITDEIGRPQVNVIKLRHRDKNQEQEQVIEKIARSFFVTVQPYGQGDA